MTQSATIPNPQRSIAAPTCLRYEQINDPGAYVCNGSGRLLRVPEDGKKPGRPPVFEILEQKQLFVTKLSDNPCITITKARMLASDCDLAVNF